MTATAAAPGDIAGTPRAVHTRTATLGLVMIASGALVMLAAYPIAGMSADEGTYFFAGGAALGLFAAALEWRFGTWAKVVGIIVALLGAFGMFWTVFGLAEPRSVADFLPGILVPGGVALAVAGSVAAIVQTRRGHFATEATLGEQRILRIVVGLVAIGALVSGALTFTGRTVAVGEGDLVVGIKSFAFDQASYTVAANTATAVKVHNGDAFVHTFTVPELGIDQTLLPGSSAIVEVNAAPGTYTLYCAPHSNMNDPNPETAGMASQIVAQ